MLCLVLQLAGDRYAIDVREVEEVLPFLNMKDLPGAPPGVSGLIDYYGRPVPVLDLSAIATGVPTPVRVSTRIAIVRYQPDGHAGHLLGLLVPRADMLRCERSGFAPAPVASPGATYLGDVLTDGGGIVQLVEVATLITPGIREALLDGQAAA